jgi:hypothetical protein
VDLETLPLEVLSEQGYQVLFVFYDQYPDAHGENLTEEEPEPILLVTRFIAILSRSPLYEFFSQADRKSLRRARKTPTHRLDPGLGTTTRAYGTKPLR